MMGLAVDPGFGSNHFIYTCYTTANDNRVVRWHVNPALTGTDGSLVLVSGIARADFHDGCRVRFGPDSKLWITTGDGAIGPAPQSLSSLNGKVLRINSDGTVPGDNPFVSTPGANPRIHDRGHRNPQGIAFRPGNGQAYSVEHGPDRDDEVNKLVPGGNYGWNPNTGGAYDQSHPMTDHSLPGCPCIDAIWSSGSPTIAPSGATFLSGAQWKSWNGTLAIAVLHRNEGGFVLVLKLDANGNLADQAIANLGSAPRLRSAVQGPDGNLYIATDVSAPNGAIWKVTPS